MAIANNTAPSIPAVPVDPTVSQRTRQFILDADAIGQTAIAMSILSFIDDNLTIDGVIPEKFYGNGSATEVVNGVTQSKPRHLTMSGKYRDIFCQAVGKSPATVSETYQSILNHKDGAKFLKITAPVDADSMGSLTLNFDKVLKLWNDGKFTVVIDRKPKAPKPVVTMATVVDAKVFQLDGIAKIAKTGTVTVNGKVKAVSDNRKKSMLNRALETVYHLDSSQLTEDAIGFVAETILCITE